MSAMKPRGKHVALSTVAVGLVVLLVAGFAGRDRIREEWYIWRLASPNKAERRASIRGLDELRSARALPYFEAMLKPFGEKDNEVRNEAACAMGRVAPQDAAVPYLLEKLKDRSVPENRRFAAWALGEIGPKARNAVLALKDALDDDHLPAQKAAAEALKKIQGTQDETPR
jgi:hypothetical protein